MSVISHKIYSDNTHCTVAIKSILIQVFVEMDHLCFLNPSLCTWAHRAKFVICTKHLCCVVVADVFKPFILVTVTALDMVITASRPLSWSQTFITCHGHRLSYFLSRSQTIPVCHGHRLDLYFYHGHRLDLYFYHGHKLSTFVMVIDTFTLLLSWSETPALVIITVSQLQKWCGDAFSFPFFFFFFFFANREIYMIRISRDHISHIQSMVAKRGLTNRANVFTPMWKSCLKQHAALKKSNRSSNFGYSCTSFHSPPKRENLKCRRVGLSLTVLCTPCSAYPQPVKPTRK